jgi:hypothetical protein
LIPPTGGEEEDKGKSSLELLEVKKNGDELVDLEACVDDSEVARRKPR